MGCVSSTIPARPLDLPFIRVCPCPPATDNVKMSRNKNRFDDRGPSNWAEQLTKYLKLQNTKPQKPRVFRSFAPGLIPG